MAVDLGAGLAVLEAASLIRPGDAGADAEYRFKHTMIQEAAYASLLRERRTELHRRVAEAILRVDPEAAMYHPAVLAFHYYHGGDAERAFRFALRAGNLARRNYAHAEAVANYDLALDVAPRLASSAVAPQVREAFLGKGNALEISGRHAQAQQVCRAMEAYARGHGDAAMEAEALIRLSASAVVTSDRSADVGTMLERAETLARQAGDRLILAQTLWNQGLRDRFRQPLRADEYFLKALEITRSPGCAELPPESGVRETEAHILVDLMVSGLTSGRRRMALYHGEEALAAFRELGNQAMVADALAGLANLNQAGAGFDTAIRYAEEGQAISEAIDNPWGFTYNGWARAQIEADRGDWSRALERATSLLAFAARVPFVGFRLALNAVLTRLWLDLGQPGRAAEHAQATARLWEENASPTEGWYSWVRAVEALSHLAMGDIPRAAQMLDEFRELPQGVIPGFQNYYYVGPVVAWLDFVRGDVERGLRFASEVIDRFDAEATDRFSAEMRTWRARLLLADGAPAEAEAELHRAIDILAPAGARAVLWPAHAARAEALTQMGDADGAQRERETAWNLIQSIADGLNPSHRVTFLARPEVARLQR